MDIGCGNAYYANYALPSNLGLQTVLLNGNVFQLVQQLVVVTQQLCSFLARTLNFKAKVVLDLGRLDRHKNNNHEQR